MTTAAQQIDANRRTINSNEAILLASEWTFVAGTTGATGAHTLFTVTGTVLLNVFGVCDTLLTAGGATTMEVGVAGETTALIAQTTGTDLDAGEVWVDAVPGFVQAVPAQQIVGDGKDVILTIGTSTLTAGVVDFYCTWRPLSLGADVTVTTPA